MTSPDYHLPSNWWLPSLQIVLRDLEPKEENHDIDTVLTMKRYCFLKRVIMLFIQCMYLSIHNDKQLSFMGWHSIFS